MKWLFWKEWNQFFSSLTGYIAIIVFLVTMALLVFIFPETNIFESGYATLFTFFETAPYVFLFLIPAVTMSMLAEERMNQTLELLVTKPLSIWQIVVGKYIAAICILLLSLLPTLVYVYIIGQLAEPQNNLDYGGIWGSYIGLFLLGCAFCAIGLFASSLTKIQIVAFVLAMFICFCMYFVFTSLSLLPWFYGKTDYVIQQIGMETHYSSLSRGIITLQDVIYFISIAIFFLWLTIISLQFNKSK